MRCWILQTCEWIGSLSAVRRGQIQPRSRCRLKRSLHKLPRSFMVCVRQCCWQRVPVQCWICRPRRRSVFSLCCWLVQGSQWIHPVRPVLGRQVLSRNVKHDMRHVSCEYALIARKLLGDRMQLQSRLHRGRRCGRVHSMCCRILQRGVWIDSLSAVLRGHLQSLCCCRLKRSLHKLPRSFILACGKHGAPRVPV